VAILCPCCQVWIGRDGALSLAPGRKTPALPLPAHRPKQTPYHVRPAALALMNAPEALSGAGPKDAMKTGC